MSERVVVLVDMDCFYCQVEQRINPALKGKPVAVVQYNKWRGGGIIAVNYEARACGVTRNMRGADAKAKCPGISLVHVPSNNEKADISKYREAGKEVINVLCQFSTSVQRASIDEAFLDLTEAVDKRMKNDTQVSIDNLQNSFIVGYESQNENTDEGRKVAVQEWLQRATNSSIDHERQLVVAAKLVEEMRAAVLRETGFTCSAGIAHNKILSKLVCGLNKPNKQTVLPISKVPHLYQTLPVKKVRHLGGKMGKDLVERLGITFMWELEKFSEAELCQKFDQKNGLWLYNIARGVDNDPVEARLIPKSIGCCKRFPGKTALKTRQEVEHWINELAVEVAARLAKDYEENVRRPRNIVVQWSAEIGASNSKTGFLSHIDQSSITKEAMVLLSKNLDVDSNILKTPVQFLGINVGKFTEEPKKENSIAKFFQKSSSKESVPSTAQIEKEDTPAATTPEKSKTGQAKSISSFFTNYAKNKALAKSPAKNVSPIKNEESEQQDSPKKQEVDADESDKIIAATDQEMTMSDYDSSRDFVENFYEPSQDVNTEAPCPQCGSLVSIIGMSEHLDHHIATDLHKELNQVAPTTIVSSGQSTSSSLGGVPGKRKYTKKTQSQNDAKKTRSIQSFFTQK